MLKIAANYTGYTNYNSSYNSKVNVSNNLSFKSNFINKNTVKVSNLKGILITLAGLLGIKVISTPTKQKLESKPEEHVVPKGSLDEEWLLNPPKKLDKAGQTVVVEEQYETNTYQYDDQGREIVNLCQARCGRTEYRTEYDDKGRVARKQRLYGDNGSELRLVGESKYKYTDDGVIQIVLKEFHTQW